MRLPGGNTYLCMTICDKECAHTTDCNMFKTFSGIYLCGTCFEAVIAYHRVGEYFAFWSWVAGALAGCRCRVPLQGAAVRVLFALWSLVAAGWCCKVLLQGGAECCLLLLAAACCCLLLLAAGADCVASTAGAASAFVVAAATAAAASDSDRRCVATYDCARAMFC